MKSIQIKFLHHRFFFHHSDEIRQYFGVKIALYFCWLRSIFLLFKTFNFEFFLSIFSFYTRALCIPALFGIYVWFHTGQNQVNRSIFINYFQMNLGVG